MLATMERVMVEDMIGQRILELLERRGWSLGDLAASSGLSKSHLSQLTRGQIGNPGTRSVQRIADAFGVSREELEGLRPVRPRPIVVAGVVQVPIVRRVSAGFDGWAETGERTAVVELDGARAKRLLGARVTGDCLSPTVEPEDVVIFDPGSRTFRDGQLVVVSHEGECLVKRAYHEPDGSVILQDNAGSEIRPNGGQLEGVVVLIQKRPDLQPRIR